MSRHRLDREAAVYLARAVEHIEAADKAVLAHKRADCAAVIAECLRLANEAMAELAHD